MARALLREHQMGDRDNLSEPEHEVLVHENLVTSGTLNFQDGTISGTGSVYADTFYVGGEALYTQAEVDDLITTLSGALQSQINELLAL
jgi:hypothetical protein